MWNQVLPKLFILSAGLLLMILQYAAGKFTDQLQINIFLAGLILFGIPHGAADRLVASNNMRYQQKHTTNLSFNFIYLGSIALFSILLFSFPFIGTLIFILLSAYHFGESDLQKVDTKEFFGKIILFNYGLCVLGVIFLPKLPQLLASISATVTNVQALAVLHQLNRHHSIILNLFLVVFAVSCILYFLKNPQAFKHCRQDLLLNILLLPMLYILPMLLSFSFYFLLWHSIFSMKTIVQYLLHNRDLSRRSIIKEILSNSAIALLGIGVFCIIASVGARQYNLVIYAVFGLAVLTAAHMQVMHQMYNQIRLKYKKQ
jgi:Brp/Blh family beta-carotene 15,15'-monooxygenase